MILKVLKSIEIKKFLKMKKNNLCLLLILFLTISCNSLPDDFITKDENVTIKKLKWPFPYEAAIAITSDSGPVNSEKEIYIQQFAEKYNIPLNYELVTSNIAESDNPNEIIDFIKNSFYPRGHSFFGHGHWHHHHDLLTYDETYDSFKKCLDFFKSIGLNVIAYAYPGGYGYKLQTQKALKNAGFYAGRMYDQIDIDNPYIVPEGVDEPENWFSLPSLIMQSYDYDACDICINNTEDLRPFIIENIKKKSLLIITYHAIGGKGQYGFYDMNDYKNDIIELSKHKNLWKAGFNDAVKYIYLRKHSDIEAKLNYNVDDFPYNMIIKFYTSLDKKIFDYPLSLEFNIPTEWLNKSLLIKSNDFIDTLSTKRNPLILNLKPSDSEYKISVLK